jgi:hypothetical protein
MASYNPKEVHPGPWATLSAIDCSDVVERKGNLSYLSWAWAWARLMEHYPEASYEVLPNETYPDGTVEVGILLQVDGQKRHMWLPVMDHRNNAIVSPNARDISDARMRCLVKAIALFGLGHYLYAGEDLPDAAKEPPKPKKNINKVKAQQYQNQLDDMVGPHEADDYDVDALGIRQLNDEIKDDGDFHKFVWSRYTTKQKQRAQAALHQLHLEEEACKEKP